MFVLVDLVLDLVLEVPLLAILLVLEPSLLSRIQATILLGMFVPDRPLTSAARLSAVVQVSTLLLPAMLQILLRVARLGTLIDLFVLEAIAKSLRASFVSLMDSVIELELPVEPKLNISVKPLSTEREELALLEELVGKATAQPLPKQFLPVDLALQLPILTIVVVALLRETPQALPNPLLLTRLDLDRESALELLALTERRQLKLELLSATR